MSSTIVSILGILITPIILFMIFVAPIWVILHYRHRNRAVQGLDATEQSKIDKLQQLAVKMEERVITLESILDSENPDWRNKL
jgi:phage shock protein B